MPTRVRLTNNKPMLKNEFVTVDRVAAANFRQHPANFWLESRKYGKLIATHSRDSLTQEVIVLIKKSQYGNHTSMGDFVGKRM